MPHFSLLCSSFVDMTPSTALHWSVFSCCEQLYEVMAELKVAHWFSSCTYSTWRNLGHGKSCFSLEISSIKQGTILNSQSESNLNKDRQIEPLVLSFKDLKSLAGETWFWKAVTVLGKSTKQSLFWQRNKPWLSNEKGKKKKGVCLQIIFNEMTQQDWIPPRNTFPNIFAKLHSISEEENPTLFLYASK